MNTEKIGPEQVKYRKEIGRLHDVPIFEVGLIGGLCLVMKADGKRRAEPLGVGPHRAVARFIAKKRNPEIEYTDLTKSDWLPVDHFRDILPQYEEMTTAFQAVR